MGLLDSTDKIVMANQPDIVVVDKWEKTAVMVNVAISSDSNIRRKKHETRRDSGSNITQEKHLGPLPTRAQSE